MGLFSKKEPPVEAEEHAVLLRFRLSDDELGSEEERAAVLALGETLERAVDGAAAGEYDGHEFGGGEAVLYLYGPDKDRLWAAVEPHARELPLRPAFALLRAGGPEVDPDRVDL